MARPRKEGMEYFPHDTDASGDEKIDAMRALFGNNGYAFYFILCERIYRTSVAELDVSKPVLLLPLIKKLLVSKEQFEEMLVAAFELNLFSRSDYEQRGVITSSGIKKRFDDVNQMRNRWRKSKEKAPQQEVFHEENDAEKHEENAEETRESKVKESKEIYIAHFDKFWSIYPNKKGKAAALKKWISYKDTIDIEKVLEGTFAYIEYCKATERTYKDGSTFVNNKSWEDDWTIPANRRYRHTEKNVVQIDFKPSEEERRYVAQAFAKQGNGLPAAYNE
ncbi:DUF4373 domain-containing protein [Paenibacillus sp. H1-7]|uniref:DUF4373 domain-containing protein n=1 Tax=Paenibacillus sp. H1-7 TaxID=2282849 RepID=UPI001EF8012C|nr:DUF4373 domain-containing protein [Paenibacillus sp. H1-7]ULL14340.1 DUF4373 domain-containing protein [Paenibacillus sp. H1-7]